MSPIRRSSPAYERSMAAADAVGRTIAFLVRRFQSIDKASWFLLGFALAWWLRA